MPGNRTLVLPVMAVLYTIASQTPWRVRVAVGSGAAAVTIIAGATWSSGPTTNHMGLLGYAIGNAACYAAAVALGLYVGARRRVLEGLRERAEGRPRPLAQGIDLSAFRIIQEALTNVVKHAAGATTKVTISYQEGGVQLTIMDSGAEIRNVLLEEPPDGHGVIGMRERAALFGGTLSTQAFPDGFKVTATLPYVSPAL
jgi:hypothetical protein